MSNNKATTTFYAEEGLEAINNHLAEAEAAIAANSPATDVSEDELQQVGGLEPMAYFYRFTAPKQPTKTAYRIFEKGQTVEGTFERMFTGGKFNNNTYVIRNSEGQLVGLPGVGSLKRAMDKLAEGSKVKITYNGMSEIKGGQWAGSDAHNFTVFGNKLKA